jgi:hypothetical protein
MVKRKKIRKLFYGSFAINDNKINGSVADKHKKI